jgi:hypothetical protein
MGVENAWNPFLVALVATMASGLQALAGGFVRPGACEFVEITARENEVLAILETSRQEVATNTSIGLLCEGDFYNDLDEDDMYRYSRSFFLASLALGGLGFVYAWAIATCFTPTLRAWRFIAFFASASALVSLPTFLILEAYPCSDDYASEQVCKLSGDSYFLMASIGFHILTTALMQFLDPPAWTSQLHHWRLPKGRTLDTYSGGEDDDDNNSQDPILTPRLAPRQRWWGQLRGDSKKSNRDVSEQSNNQVYSYALPLKGGDLERGDSLVEEEVVSLRDSSPEDEPASKTWTSFPPQSSAFREKKTFTNEIDEEQQLADVDFEDTSRAPPAIEAVRSKSFDSRSVSDENDEVPLIHQHESSDSQPVFANEPMRRNLNTRVQSAPVMQSKRSTEAYAIEPLRRPQSERPVVETVRTKSSEEVSVSMGVSQINRTSEDQEPVSPLTHLTMDFSPSSPSIERTTIREPILKYSAVVTPDSRNVNDTDLTTPVKRLDLSGTESVLDHLQGEDSILDTPPGIPSMDKSRKMAQEEAYADQNDGTKSSTMGYNIDDMIDAQDATDALMQDSLLGSEDMKLIALEGTPIYASLLLEEERQSWDEANDAGKIVASNSEFDSVLPKRKKKFTNATKAKESNLQPFIPNEAALQALANYNAQQILRSDQPSDDRIQRSYERGKAKRGVARWGKSGYAKMDDDPFGDDESAQESPPMTEVSFDPNEVQEVSLDKDESHFAGTKSEKMLLEDWNKMFDAQGPVPVKMKEDVEDEDREVLLQTLSPTHYSDDDPKRGDGDSIGDSSSGGSSPRKTSSKTGKTTLRPRRRSRHSRSRAGGSVGSSTSLLSHTIAEETASDIEDFNKEQNPLPLAGYAAQSDQRNVVNSLIMSGMHTYANVEHYRSDDENAKNAAKEYELKRKRSRSLDTRAKSRNSNLRSLSPIAARVSHWRYERENRVGIHGAAVVSSSESEGDDETGRKATMNDLRLSRIQRLQQNATPVITANAAARTRMRRANLPTQPSASSARQSFGARRVTAAAPVTQPPKEPTEAETVAVVEPTEEGSAASIADSTVASMPMPVKKSVDPPAWGASGGGGTGDDGSNTTTPDDVGEVGSFMMSLFDVELNDLDASLAALSRPDGSEYGPDELSI